MVTDRPNILLILTDQHRLSAIGAYGDTVCQTPNIDRLAAQGVRFETVYTTCPVCSPARGTIMTGQYPHRHGITSNVHNLGCNVHELQDRPALLSRRLETVGYQLGYSGKWHLGTSQKSSFGGPNEPSLPKDVGFQGQNFPGHGGGGFRYPEYKQYLADNGYTHELKPWAEDAKQFLPTAELEGPVESTMPYFLTQNTIDLIDQFSEAEAPFFIWHNFWGPHAPYYAPSEYVDRYRDVPIPEWPNYRWPSRQIPGPHSVKIHPEHEQLSWSDWETAVRYYYAFTTLIDDQVGRMLAHLEDRDLAANTVVIFAADHGETLGSHGGLMDKGWHHFEEIHRIPLIMRLPDGGCAGEVRTPFVSLADLYPTICEFAGAEATSVPLDGRSLLPLMDDADVAWRDTVVSEFGGVNNLATTQRTLRHGQFKYGYNCNCPDELYDLDQDPWETSNLLNHPDHRDTASALRLRLADWMTETQDPALAMFEHTLTLNRDR